MDKKALEIMNIEDYEKQLTTKEEETEPAVFIPVQINPIQVNYEWQTQLMAHWGPVPIAAPPAPLRQTGRTTRMILGALFELSEGRDIVFVSPNNTMARFLRSKVNDLLDILQMQNFRNFVTYTARNRTGGVDFGINRENTRIYYDHTCGEEYENLNPFTSL